MIKIESVTSRFVPEMHIAQLSSDHNGLHAVKIAVIKRRAIE